MVRNKSTLALLRLLSKLDIKQAGRQLRSIAILRNMGSGGFPISDPSKHTVLTNILPK